MSIVALVAILGLNPRKARATQDPDTNLREPAVSFLFDRLRPVERQRPVGAGSARSSQPSATAEHTAGRR
jgi:hypothetical protein